MWFNGSVSKEVFRLVPSPLFALYKKIVFETASWFFVNEISHRDDSV